MSLNFVSDAVLYPSWTSQDGFIMSKDGLTFFTTLCQSTINDKRENEKNLSSQVRSDHGYQYSALTSFSEECS